MTDGTPEGAVRLTSLSHGGGCACKIRQVDLVEVLGRLPLGPADPSVLVGLTTADDAAVVRLTPDIGLVLTTDFFTPIVDDPYAFGQIAATNALSDVYAMGGVPRYALNLVCFPTKTLPLTILGEILRGAAEKAREAEVSIVGGHTIDDPEPKFGLAVVGTVHPDRVLRKGGARPGDVLVLTKPIGTGILSSALKRGLASPAMVEEMTRAMTTLNRAASEAACAAGARAMTDVTGYGLLGHLLEMCRAGQVGARIEAAQVPLLGGVLELIAQGVVPGGTRSNLEFAGASIDWSPAVDPALRTVLCDAQTSGGLLAALPPGALPRWATPIGEVTARPAGSWIAVV